MIPNVLESWFASDDVKIVFQPIFDITGALVPFAVEALTRGPAGTQFENAGVFFEPIEPRTTTIKETRACRERRSFSWTTPTPS